MNLAIAIVDDRREDREALSAAVSTYFDRHPGHSVSFRFFDSAEAMLAAKPPVQMAFLDICMGGLSGIDLARVLRSLDEKLLIVFLSTSSDFAFDAFPVHPFDYLIKPARQADVDRVLGEAMRVVSAEDPEVEIRVARDVNRVPLRRIVSAVASGHNVEIAVDGGSKLRSIMTFAEVSELLQDPRFLPCNRGVLVNMDYVLTLDGDVLRMKDGRTFALRTRSKAELSARFVQYQISRLKGERL